MNHVHIAGLGFWTPGFATPEAWLEGARDPEATVAPTSLVNKRHLRFCSTLTQMSVSVFEQAVNGLELDLSTVDIMFASSQGEVQIAVELLDKIAAEGSGSPARFMNSVHNTVPGHLSIATKSHGNFSALAGGGQTVSAALLEAMCLLQDPEHDKVAVIVGEESLPPPLDLLTYESMAFSLLLSREPVASSLGTLGELSCDPSADVFAVPAAFASSPTAASLGVLDAIGRRQSGRIRLDGKDGEGWCVMYEAAQ